MSSLRRALENYTANNMHSFHTPGHKGSNDLLDNILLPQYDLTELPGLDMLHNPSGIIAEAQRSAAEVFGADETFFLVNGATVGNQAMFLAIAPALRGRKVRIDRRAHRSVSAALILSGIMPDYIQPVVHPDFDLALGVDTDQIIKTHSQDIGGIHLTNPTYYGTLMDIKALTSLRDVFAADLPVLVDQAHGAHLYGTLFPAGALESGADAVLHSTHKTLGALTQAAMLHLKGNRINTTLLKKSLELLQSSSPSYLLLSSLEKAAEQIQSKEWNQMWQDLQQEVRTLHDKLEDKLRILSEKDEGQYGIYKVDWSKILVNVSSLKLSAHEVVDILRKTYGIEPELWDDQNILFMLGVGTKPQEVGYLSESLEQIVNTYYNTKDNYHQEHNQFANELARSGLEIPPVVLTPREAWFSKKKKINIHSALGCVSAETISVYPPGIPLIAAGEMITSRVLEVLSRPEAVKWQGWEGFGHGEIWIVDE